MEPIVRAVDVGRRNTKYIAAIKDNKPMVASFPSSAPACDKAADEGSGAAARNTVTIKIGALLYEVGPDVHLAAGRFDAHMMQNDRYWETDEYLALTLGALRMMQVRKIDLLGIGVPMALFKQSKPVQTIERRLVGEHRLGGSRVVEVVNVRALAQPAGALMHYGVCENKFPELNQQRNLAIDVGSRTFDWLCARGLQAIASRSHSVDRGMFDVLEAFTVGIEASTGQAYRDVETIDRALRSGDKPLVFQRPYEIGRHMAMARKIPQQAIAEMLRYTGNGADFDNIILAGGGRLLLPVGAAGWLPASPDN